jgi:hypothetical protein
MEQEILYADFIVGDKNNDMFVITPEGTRFKFDAPEYNENHADIAIIDPWSHKRYTVVFNE